MIAKLKKLFFETNISWVKVILLAVLCGIIPGLLMVPAALKGTSLQQPGISFEFWIFMAMFIILNSKKPTEAGLKTFVFFLISQPLVYLVQVPFASLGWKIFSYYPRWGIITLLTLPGGMIAWFTKKGNLLSILILSVANLILCYQLPSAVKMMLDGFPRYILYVLFTIFCIVLFIFILFEKGSQRLIAFGIVLVLLAGSIFYYYKTEYIPDSSFSTELEGTAPFEIVSDTSGVDVSIDGNTLTVGVDYFCSFPIDIKDADGNIVTVNFVYGENGADWQYES